MPALHELQRAFGASLLDPAALPSLLPLLEGPDASLRFAVYRGNMYGNCVGALAGAYPIVRAIVGEAFFEAMGKEYARAHPSASGDLSEFGHAFAAFVAQFEHTQDLPYLPDVARLEWLAHRAWFARDAAPFPFCRLSGDACPDPGALRPVLAPSCALLESAWPIARIWETHNDPRSDPAGVDLQAGPERVLVYRPRWHVEVAPLDAGDFRFLAAAAAGCTLGEALEAALAESMEFDPGSALARWVSAGVVVDLI
jgi:hypothetical protein